MTRGEIMRGLSMAMTLQNATGVGKQGPVSLFAPAFKYFVQNNGNSPSIVLNSDGSSYLTKPGVWNANYCFGVQIPRTARRVKLHMRIVDAPNQQYQRQVLVGYRSDYAAQNQDIWTGNIIAYVTSSFMTTEQLMAQDHVIDLSLTSNVSIAEQDVVLDVGFIHDDAFLVLYVTNQVIYLYSIEIE